MLNGRQEREGLDHKLLTKQHRLSTLDAYLEAQLLDAGTDKLTGPEVIGMLVEDLVKRAGDRGFRLGLMEQRTLFNIPPQVEIPVKSVGTQPSTDPNIVTAGPFILDVARGVLTTPYKDPPEVDLTVMETRLASTLMRNPGRLVTYSVLVYNLWPNGGGEDNLIKTHLTHIRNKSGDPKIGKRGSRHFCVKNGMGYMFKE